MDFCRRLLKLKCGIAIYNIWQSRKEKKLLGITGNLNTMLVWGFFHLIVFINPFSNWFCISRSWSKVYQKGLCYRKIKDWWKFCLEAKSLLSDYLVMKHNTCEIRTSILFFYYLFYESKQYLSAPHSSDWKWSLYIVLQEGHKIQSAQRFVVKNLVKYNYIFYLLI